MTLSIFFLLLISHVMGDAVFTSYRLAVLKRSQGLFDQLLAISYHSAVHGLFAGLFLLVLGKLWLKGALLVLALHFAIDFLRCRVERNQAIWSWKNTCETFRAHQLDIRKGQRAGEDEDEQVMALVHYSPCGSRSTPRESIWYSPGGLDNGGPYG